MTVNTFKYKNTILDENSKLNGSGSNSIKFGGFEWHAIVKQRFVCRAAASCHNDTQDGSDEMALMTDQNYFILGSK